MAATHKTPSKLCFLYAFQSKSMALEPDGHPQYTFKSRLPIKIHGSGAWPPPTRHLQSSAFYTPSNQNPKFWGLAATHQTFKPRFSIRCPIKTHVRSNKFCKFDIAVSTLENELAGGPARKPGWGYRLGIGYRGFPFCRCACFVLSLSPSPAVPALSPPFPSPLHLA